MKIIAFLIFLTSASFASSKMVKDFDAKFYNPIDLGIKDMSFEIHHSTITTDFKKRFQISGVKEIYFKVYYLKGKDPAIQVHGLPAGYKELKEELKKLVVNRLDFVFPKKIYSNYSTYKFEKKGNNQVVAKDMTYTNDVLEVYFNFNDDGSLASMRLKAASAGRSSKMKYEKYDWAKKKFILSEVEAKSVQGIYITNIKNEIEYSKFEKYGLPVKIETSVTQKLNTNQNIKASDSKLTGESTITFKEYKINQREAKEYFSKLKD